MFQTLLFTISEWFRSFNVVQCKEIYDLVIFSYFGGLKLPISRKVQAISQKWQNFKKNVIFTLFGLKSIKKTLGHHDLRKAPKKAHLMPTPIHKKQLRIVLNIRFPHHISNKAVYKACNTEPLSLGIITKRWRYVGHALRLNLETPQQC